MDNKAKSLLNKFTTGIQYCIIKSVLKQKMYNFKLQKRLHYPSI